VAQIREKLAEMSDEEKGQLILNKEKEPVIPFDPERDVKTENNAEKASLDDQVRKAISLIDKTDKFTNQEVLLKFLKELAVEGRIFYAENLPGTFRAQKMRLPDGSLGFSILGDRSLSFLFDGDGKYYQNLSPPQREAITAFLAAKLLHETAEILMESHPEINWENPLDPELPNTEYVATSTEMNFLAQVPDFLTHFKELLIPEVHPPKSLPTNAWYKRIFGRAGI